MNSMDKITAPKLAAFSKKHTPAPNTLSTIPDNAGPSNCARLAVAVESESAFGKSSGLATTSFIKACRAGMSKAFIMPSIH